MLRSLSQMDFCLGQIIPRLPSRQNYCETSICILLSDCRVVFSHHIPLLRPTFCSSITKKAEDSPVGYFTKETWFYRLDMPEGYKHFSKQNRCVWSIVILSKNGGMTVRKSLLRKGTKARCYSVEDLIASDCNFDLCKFPKEDEENFASGRALLADYYKKRAALDHEIDKTLAEIQKILGN